VDGRDLVRLHGRLAAGVLQPPRHAARAVGAEALRRARPAPPPSAAGHRPATPSRSAPARRCSRWRAPARAASSAPAPAPARGQRAVGGITERERDVLTLIGRGLSNTEIAADLTLSIATVKTYVTRLLTKLDARDRVQLVIIAYDAGLVAPAR